MKRIFLFALFLVTACAPTPTPAPTLIATLVSSPTFTSTPAPTATITPSLTPSLPADVEAVLADEPGYQVFENDKIVSADGETLFRWVPEADRYDPSIEWQRYITFTTTDNEKIEMPRFESIDDALNYISKYAFWRTGDRRQSLDSWLKTPGKYVFGHPVVIRGLEMRESYTSPSNGENFVLIATWSINGKTALLFEDKNTDFIMIYIDYDSNGLNKEDFNVPIPQQ